MPLSCLWLQWATTLPRQITSFRLDYLVSIIKHPLLWSWKLYLMFLLNYFIPILHWLQWKQHSPVRNTCVNSALIFWVSSGSGCWVKSRSRSCYQDPTLTWSNHILSVEAVIMAGIYCKALRHLHITDLIFTTILCKRTIISPDSHRRKPRHRQLETLPQGYMRSKWWNQCWNPSGLPGSLPLCHISCQWPDILKLRVPGGGPISQQGIFAWKLS